jgi:hypothetical protein
MHKTQIGRIDTLAEQINQTKEHGAYINLSKTIPKLSAEAFYPVYHYLKYGDFSPRLSVQGNTDHIHWDDRADHGDQIASVGNAFLGAWLLQISTMQDLCFRKLRAMSPISPKVFM